MPVPDDLTAALERVLVGLARDPGEAVWRPGWAGSAPVKAAILAQYQQLGDAVYGATAHGAGLTAGSVHDALAAAEMLAGLFRRAAWERAAAALAVMRAAGLRVTVRDGRLRVGPPELVTDDHKRMAADWREYLIELVARAKG